MLKSWASLIILPCLAACSGLPFDTVAPQVSVADVAIRRIGLLEQGFDVGLRITNPNDFDLTVVALEFDIEVNDRPLLNGLTHTATRIPAVATGVLRVEAFMKSKDLLLQLKSLPPAGLKAGVPYRVKGRIRTDRSSRWQSFDHRGVYGGADAPPESGAM
jgi:LEA14-like dessication related protein